MLVIVSNYKYIGRSENQTSGPRMILKCSCAVFAAVCPVVCHCCFPCRLKYLLWWLVGLTWNCVCKLDGKYTRKCAVQLEVRPELVLFFVTKLKTRSSSAFEWGSVSTKRATLVSFWNISEPSGFFSVVMWDQMMSILWCRASCSQTTADCHTCSGMSDSLMSWYWRNSSSNSLSSADV